jgi:hypothetical protein
MKKALFVAAVTGAMLVGLTSCTKDYTCSCTYNWGSSDTTITLLYEGAKKADAEEGCEASEASLKVLDSNASCTLE